MRVVTIAMIWPTLASSLASILGFSLFRGVFRTQSSIYDEAFCENSWKPWTVFAKTRSSRPEVFCKKGVLRNFAKFTGKQYLYQGLFFNKAAGLNVLKVTLCTLDIMIFRGMNSKLLQKNLLPKKREENM